MIWKIHPFESDLLEQRTKLLQNSLRDSLVPYRIDQEFPIVLNPTHKNLSFCVTDEKKQLLAHANFWPRHFWDRDLQKSFAVALVGNVATHPEFRNKGIMTQLLNFLWEKARNLEFEALVLWSDSAKFYRGLGFLGFGTEYRWVFRREGFTPSLGTGVFKLEQARQFDDLEYDKLIALRYPTQVTLLRTASEFKKYISIPETYLFTLRNFEEIEAYAVLGKGADMSELIHEWGAKNPQKILELINFILSYLQRFELALLTPVDLSEEWLSAFIKVNASYNHRSMALGKFLPDSAIAKLSPRCFIWGLDSI